MHYYIISAQLSNIDEKVNFGKYDINKWESGSMNEDEISEVIKLNNFDIDLMECKIALGNCRYSDNQIKDRLTEHYLNLPLNEKLEYDFDIIKKSVKFGLIN